MSKQPNTLCVKTSKKLNNNVISTTTKWSLLCFPLIWTNTHIRTACCFGGWYHIWNPYILYRLLCNFSLVYECNLNTVNVFFFTKIQFSWKECFLNFHRYLFSQYIWNYILYMVNAFFPQIQLDPRDKKIFTVVVQILGLHYVFICVGIPIATKAV